MKLRDKREIGSAKDLIKFIFHVEGSPVEQAEAIKELLDMGYTQKDIAKMLGWSHAKVNQRLAYLKLIPELRKKAKKGEISKYTAWHLAHLPEEEQRKFVDKEKITLRDAEDARRNLYIPEEDYNRFMDILENDLESKSDDLVVSINLPKDIVEFKKKYFPDHSIEEFIIMALTRYIESYKINTY